MFNYKLTLFPPRNFDEELSFIVPIILDKNFRKMQIFTTSKILSDLLGMAKLIYYINFDVKLL